MADQERVRELLRYFQPATTRQITRKSSKDLSETNNTNETKLEEGPWLSADPTLTSLAQLGALRLRCQRSFISLMDHQNQYIIAEATRSISSYEEDNYDDEEDKLFLGAKKLDLTWGVCPNTIQVFTCSDGSLEVSSAHISANSSYYVMTDLSKIDAYKDRPYVAGWPFMKFYAEVPIRSPKGYTIGTYCVVDDKPRNELGKKGLACLTEIATTIMSHLELVRVRQMQLRADSMLQKLNVFVDGRDSTLKMTNNQGSFPQLMGMTTDQLSYGQAQVKTIQNNSIDSIDIASTPPTSFEEASSSTDPSIVKNEQTPRGSEIDSYDSSTHDKSQRGDDVSENLIRSRNASVKPETLGGDSQLPNVFLRATVLLKQGLELDGVCFLDAIGVDRSVQEDDAETFQAKHNLKLSSEQIRRLLISYPKGHIFNRIMVQQDFVSTKSPEKSTHGSTRKQSIPDRNHMTYSMFDGAPELSDALPEAQTLIFLPLMSSQWERWFTVIVAWSESATRVLQREDFLYASAFANSVMAEVARADALLAVSAKSRFISSISHELRSPLHGVLANAEALQDTSTSAIQDDFIQSIEVCGRILLDTMNHLLDYAKTHDMAKTRAEIAEVDGKNGRARKASAADETVDLQILVEEVVQSIYSGHLYSKALLSVRSNSTIGVESKKQQTGYFSDNQSVSTPGLVEDAVLVTINTGPPCSWRFNTQVGVWNSIVMNVVGNALKYTDAGCIRISLDCGEDASDTAGDNRKTVMLGVRDTGRGMSTDFIRNHLYTPFTQEDSLSAGTGLGMSIVRQLVSNLGGDISIDSEQGSGTNLRITVPLEHASDLNAEFLSEKIQEMRDETQGLRLCLVDFDADLKHPSASTGFFDMYSTQLGALRESITQSGAIWFGMRVMRAKSITAVQADVYVVLYPTFLAIQKSWQNEGAQPDHPFRMVVVGGQALTSPQPSLAQHAGVAYLQQPFGVRSFGKALAQCLKSPISDLNDPQHAGMESVVNSGSGTLNEAEVQYQNTNITDACARTRVSEDVPIITKDVRKENETSSSLYKLDFHSPFQSSSTTQVNLKPDTLTPLPHPRVLLVEDNAINMKVLTQYMLKLRYEFSCAENGQQAVDAYQSATKRFGIVLMDISMPIMNGIDATVHIRNYERLHDLRPAKIIALTCLASDEARSQALCNGLDIFLVKPISMKKLGQMLQDMSLGVGERLESDINVQL